MGTRLPDEIRCPISLEIMSDPVILQSGHTFDRVSIQRWLETGHRTCPISKLPLPEKPVLIPNHALRSLISNYALVSPQLSGSFPAHNEPQSLISVLNSPSSSLGSKLESLTQLVRLTRRESSLRKKVTDLGALPGVLSCVDSDNSRLQGKALSLLLNLSLDDDNKVGLVAEGAISRLVRVLQVGASDCRAVAATVLTSLAVVEVNKATIGSYPEAITSLVSLLRDGAGGEKKEAATALYTLCSFPGNRKRVVDCGSVPILVQAADSGLERAVEVLGVVVKCWEGREEMRKVCGLVKVLIKVLRSGSSKGIQYSLFTLNCLCCSSVEILNEVRREEIFDVCMGLKEDENEKIRRGARNLIKTLHGISTTA